MSVNVPKGPHRFATVLAGCVVLLIAAGALVKSREAGLSVPDWPLSYGGLNPPGWWRIANVRAEHGHRLIAGTVALLTFFLALWIQRREPRRRVRGIAWAAFAAVLLQALLGGLTVLFFLPPAISISHAALAELFLGLVVTLAVVTGERWRSPVEADGPARRLLRPLAAALPALVFVQILLGALVRHLGAGLAIPDFPLAFGRLLPPRFDTGIAIHFAHRVGALAVLGLIAAVAVRGWRAGRDTPLRRTLAALVGLVAVQIVLGGLVVWTGRDVLPNTVHVAVGASLWATSVTLALQSWREPLRRALAAPAGARAAERRAEPARASTS